MGKRREILRNLKSDLEKMDSDYDNGGARKGLSTIEDTFGSRLASSSSTSYNVKQRSVKSTVTSETVRS